MPVSQMRIHFISSETVETLTSILLCSLVFCCYTSVGGSRFSEGTSADREIQRTLMELLNQMDGFEDQGQVKMVMATNRPDVSLLLCVEI